MNCNTFRKKRKRKKEWKKEEKKERRKGGRKEGKERKKDWGTWELVKIFRYNTKNTIHKKKKINKLDVIKFFCLGFSGSQV